MSVRTNRDVMATLDSSRLTETFDLLTHPHRRYVLYYLTRESEAVDVATLAASLVEWDGDHARTDRLTRIENVTAGLYHTHLPKLADAGVIAFGPNMDSIELRAIDGLGRFLGETASIDDFTKTAANS